MTMNVDAMAIANWKQRRKIRDANFGRDGGWQLELDGEAIALLTDARSEDMFWDSYRLEVVARDDGLAGRMTDATFWHSEKAMRLVWRSRTFGLAVADVVVAEQPFVDAGRLMVRGLYLDVTPTRWWERVAVKMGVG